MSFKVRYCYGPYGAIIKDSSGFYAERDRLGITRSNTFKEICDKIDFLQSLGSKRNDDLKEFRVTMESMCDESFQTFIWVSAANEEDAMVTANDLVSDNEYRAVSAVECDE